MDERKKTILQAIVIGFLLLLTLPLFYLLMSRVLLPLGWNEPQFEQEEHVEERVSEPQ